MDLTVFLRGGISPSVADESIYVNSVISTASLQIIADQNPRASESEDLCDAPLSQILDHTGRSASTTMTYRTRDLQALATATRRRLEMCLRTLLSVVATSAFISAHKREILPR